MKPGEVVANLSASFFGGSFGISDTNESLPVFAHIFNSPATTFEPDDLILIKTKIFSVLRVLGLMALRLYF